MQDIEERDLGLRGLSALSSNERGRAGTKLMGSWPADNKFIAEGGGQGVAKQADQFPDFALAFYFIILYYMLLNTSVLVNKIKCNKFLSVLSNFAVNIFSFTDSFVSFKCVFGMA